MPGINMFLKEYGDQQDQVLWPLKLKKASVAFQIESLLENTFL